jgi:hypothetical protein
MIVLAAMVLAFYLGREKPDEKLGLYLDSVVVS